MSSEKQQRVQAWAPGHATFFFAVPSEHSDPLAMGSIGGGLNFATGVTTSVQSATSPSIRWNMRSIEGNVTKTAIDLFEKETGVEVKVEIQHTSHIPIGYGLSTSGAGAIGTILALNRFFATDLSPLRCFQLAHIAEVQNHTGLGSVIGQITGGIEIRTSPGGPGIGKTRWYPADDEVILLFFGPLKTSDVITSRTQMTQVNQAGIKAVNAIQNVSDDILTHMFELGDRFTKSCGLLTQRLTVVQESLASMGETMTVMAQIGETLVVRPENTALIVQWAKDHQIQYRKTKITTEKPHVVKS